MDIYLWGNQHIPQIFGIFLRWFSGFPVWWDMDSFPGGYLQIGLMNCSKDLHTHPRVVLSMSMDVLTIFSDGKMPSNSVWIHEPDMEMYTYKLGFFHLYGKIRIHVWIILDYGIFYLHFLLSNSVFWSHVGLKNIPKKPIRSASGIGFSPTVSSLGFPGSLSGHGSKLQAPSSSWRFLTFLQRFETPPVPQKQHRAREAWAREAFSSVHFMSLR